ncbi:MAG: hypothetical protein ABSD51_08660, partial [Candidatus Binatus sp.]
MNGKFIALVALDGRPWISDMVDDPRFITDPIGLECKSIMTQSYLTCNPSLKKKLKPGKLDRTMFGINRRIRSVEPQFHDDR